MRSAALTLASMVMLVLLACTEEPPPTFDANRAFSYLEAQIAFGPRIPGTPAWAECRTWMREQLEAQGATVDSQVFTFFDPYSQSEKPLVNLIGKYRPRGDEPAILLGAHWDTRPRTDFHTDTTRINEPIQGANDGASGVAVLLELANLFAQQPPPCNVDLILFDGEDWGKAGDLDMYLLGSRHFAQQGIHDQYRFGIVVDLVGDIDQQFPREGFSEKYYPEVNDMIWSAAAELRVSTFVDTVIQNVFDDHLSISSGGVPAVVVIDFDYDYWHTEFDTPDKCSPASLDNVGSVLVKILYDRSLWPKKK